MSDDTSTNARAEMLMGRRPEATAPHDWRAEAAGLAWMISKIHADYLEAKLLGGDSEILGSSIGSAFRYVNDPATRQTFEQE